MNRMTDCGRCLLTVTLTLICLAGCKSYLEDDGDGWTNEVENSQAQSAPVSDTKTDTKAETKADNASGTVKAADLIPLKERTFKIEYNEGRMKGKTVEVTVTKGEKGQWVESAKDVRILNYGEVDGGIGLPREEDFDEGVIVTYDPAFILMPKELVAGKPFESKTKMTVLNRGSGSKKAGGTCSYKVELVRQEKIQTPAGAFDAYLIRTTRDISLDLASVKVTVQTWHVPGKGMVASHVKQTTAALGIFSSEKVEAWKLAK